MQLYDITSVATYLVGNKCYVGFLGTLASRPTAELEIAVGHWPFSDQFSPFGRANPIC